jgi:hypothetical protein
VQDAFQNYAGGKEIPMERFAFSDTTDEFLFEDILTTSGFERDPLQAAHDRFNAEWVGWINDTLAALVPAD